MAFEYKGQKFMTDNNLKVDVLGFWPQRDIQNKKLKEKFKKESGRNFLGGDEIVSYAQPLVSSGMDFEALEQEIFEDVEKGKKLKDIVSDKTATGIGRGHSLGGLSGIVFGIHGTKMIDSGLTGLVASRSLVTSSRRRKTTTEEIVIPESLTKREDLLKEYLEISKDVFNVASEFKEKFGKLGGVETFNKVLPYNNPADLLIVVPLDTMATLYFEIKQDRANPNGHFVPRELENLADMFSGLADKAGIGTMYSQRIKVPRDTYFHYTVFKDPSLSNYALEHAKLRDMPLKPIVIEYSKDITFGFKTELKKLEQLFEEAKKINEPEKLAKKAMNNMLALRSFVGDYNEAIGVKILDSLSWRVWSEQKRHATLRQNVESVYSAVKRDYEGIKKLWPEIENTYKNPENKLPYEELDKFIVIDDKLKKNPELAVPYVYHTAKQLMFYGKLLDEGFEGRDALYIVPKNIRLRTLENYDLINLVDLELPLRLCKSCEPERYATSWKKRDAIIEFFPELDFLIQPKCNVGFCTEGNYCGHITGMKEYNKKLHEETKKAMMGN